MTVQDRDVLVRRLQEDLIGPFEEKEILTSRPSDVYLTGILWPKSTKMGEEEDDHLGLSGVSGDEGDGSSRSGEEEEVSKFGMNRPSTAGISFAVASHDQEPVVSVKITFAIYEQMEEADETVLLEAKTCKKNPNSKWQRHPVFIEIQDLAVGPSSDPILTILDDHGAPPGVHLHRRIAPWGANWLITLTLVNGYQVIGWDREVIEQHSLFQVKIEVYAGSGTQLIARPSQNIGSEGDQDEEDCSTALLYRDAHEYAVGHTCSAEWEIIEAEGRVKIATTWIPKVPVLATSPSGHSVFGTLGRMTGTQPLSAEWLSNASDNDLERALLEIPKAYNSWIELQEEKLGSLGIMYREQATRNLQNCRMIRDRMAEGATTIGRSQKMAEAFRLANRAMHLQYSWDSERRSRGPLTWRPFQLGFILLAIASIADRTHRDRNTMDLLWFPTGGGKTEAYLGLIAFLAFHRRLSAVDNPDAGAGVAAIMRYTLRLLTTQQFIRASSVMLACEAIRRGTAGEHRESADLGNTPFSIGLWVGGEATPNKYDEACSALRGAPNLPTPAQLIDCPSCGNRLEWYCDPPKRAIRVRCNNHKCILYAKNDPLPVFTVDTDIYRECPTLLIGTVDKFAQIVRKNQINGLFSIHNGNPPDLIIQDELHLISGPLGTLVGLYEVAIDRMFTRERAVPKIIGSTATIRRAYDQVQALFNREVCQFPPPAIDADDSGFAVRDPDMPGRLYIGVTTAGRSAKFTLQAVASSLLQSATSGLTVKGQDNYWTMVCYFNSLRELGGAVVLMQDDVNDSIAMLADRHSESPRAINPPGELTSLRTQAEVRDMLDRLAISAGKDGSLDAVLATNMLSVGVDIPRLGLMVVNGQPKGISEYIQATSRVGRGRVPGLIVAVLNKAKPRDLSHYESFSTWHTTLYRDVEATSVTPFAPRARDRALHAVLVSLIRNLVPGMLNDPPELTPEMHADIESIIEDIVYRANAVDAEETAVAGELRQLLHEWRDRNPQYYWDYKKPQQSLLQDAERAAALRAMGRSVGLAWPTMNNLRSVEPSTRFRLTERLRDPDVDGDRHGQ